MTPVSRLMLRNAILLEGMDRVLWLNPPMDCPWRELAPGPDRLSLFCQDRGDWRRLTATGAAVAFGTFPEPGTAFDCVVLTLPRAKDKLRMLAHFSAGALSASGCLLLGGENRAGIKSSARHIEPWFGAVQRVDSARHCVLFRATRPAVEPFALNSYCAEWALQEPGLRLKVLSWPGVFAHGALDAGTRLLLQHMPDPGPDAAVLDIACGAGIIGATILQRCPGIRCTLADSDALACRSAAATLEANGLEAEVVASDGFSDLQGRFDLIVSNPPFHRDRHADAALGPNLLGPVRNFLNPDGQFVMVANRHLPYRCWLDEVFGSHVLMAADSRYHVLSATRATAQAKARNRGMNR